MTDHAPGLKCVIAWSDKRYLCSTIEDALRSLAGADEVRRLGDDALLVNTPSSAAHLRDALSPLLQDGESLLVLDFETWSSHGPGVDSTWLLRRGH